MIRPVRHPRRALCSVAPRALAVCLAAAAGSSALADSTLIPPLETGPKIVDLKKIGNKWEMRDAGNGKLIMQERNCVPQTQVFDGEVQRVVEIRPQPTGYDMVVTFTNPTSSAKPAGAMYAGMFTLGPAVTYFDFRYGSQPVPANFSTYVGQAYNYPDSQYSPVWVFMNGEYAVGVSLLFPMNEYQHDARMGLMNPTGSNDGEGGKGWGLSAVVSNRTSNPADKLLPFPSMIPPGQERTYVMCVRVTNNPSDWVRTLLPYRRYFRETFGGVTYRRQGMPLQPVVIAESGYLEPSNPMGFTYIASRRPDVFGWKPWADALAQANKSCIHMLWAPTGLYYARQEENFPWQMTSHWKTDPKLATALDPKLGLRPAADSGTHLGLWWGRSAEIATEWEDSEIVNFDPDNIAHREAAFHEMDLAVQAGVTSVGLDTFNPGRVQVAKLYQWLRDLRLRYPDVRFIVEPNACDMLHSLAGSFIAGWKDAQRPDTVEGLYRVNAPHALADFLLPGHETFLAFRYNGYRQYFNIDPTPEMIEADMLKFAAMGYTPAMFEDMSTTPKMSIARTWETTVPTDLRLSPAMHPLVRGMTTALGGSYRSDERQDANQDRGGEGGGGGGGGSNSSRGSARITLGSLPRFDSSAKKPEEPGVVSAGVHTIVNSAKSAAAPTSVSGALASGAAQSSSASDAINRAGTFGAIRSKYSKTTKSKVSSGPTRVVTSTTKTAAAEKSED